MYIVYKEIAKGWHRRILITNDYEYAITFAINSNKCHLEYRR